MRGPPESTRTDHRFRYTRRVRSARLRPAWGPRMGDARDARSQRAGESPRAVRRAAHGGGSAADGGSAGCRRAAGVHRVHGARAVRGRGRTRRRSEEHTSELQSLMRISYAVFCLKKKNIIQRLTIDHNYKSYTFYKTL